VVVLLHGGGAGMYDAKFSCGCLWSGESHLFFFFSGNADSGGGGLVLLPFFW
jgi:hypothetical protein